MMETRRLAEPWEGEDGPTEQPLEELLQSVL